ncbi:helix-turn-helix domain-containing protein [Staphylococcus xylosus]|uniref:helix-turn-helix domain-containing protein n=1 Tax=Staphylococcus xylosus TaxID=1288 RepID=UPI000D1F31D6|nr:helix-turn-helix transcriptional regulator [Staphylococcus xylosus]PTI11875.1 hypothetical protein BU115_14160 [Staphylococcus xylosus]HDP5827296.1 helix-turn-helix transcriptional regulator [Staphylococcus aureus]
MKSSVTSIYAKKIALKMAVVENETTLKQLAADTNSHYQTIAQIATGNFATSPLRAKAIADVLNKNVEDIFET